MGEGGLLERYCDAWPGLKQERQHKVQHKVPGRFQKRPPCVCHLATAGISGQQLVTEGRGATLVPHPPTDVSPQFSQAADAINRELFVMQIQVTRQLPL